MYEANGSAALFVPGVNFGPYDLAHDRIPSTSTGFLQHIQRPTRSKSTVSPGIHFIECEADFEDAHPRFSNEPITNPATIEVPKRPNSRKNDSKGPAI